MKQLSKQLSKQFSHTVARVATLALAVAAPLSFARAQALPDAKALLAKHDAAIGGRAAMEKHSSMHQTGTISIAVANVTGSMEVFRAKPSQLVQKQSLGPLGDVVQGYDGKVAWVTSSQGNQVLDGDAATEMKKQADFFSEYYDPTKTKSAATVELVDFEGKKCYKVKIVRLDDSETFNYFDSESGLRVGQTLKMQMAGQSMDATVVISNYKDFDGVKIPMKIVRKLAMADIVLDVSAIEFDKVDASVFALPDAIKSQVKP